jgi:hypothetical protein
MTSYVRSADATRIAFDRLGHGPVVVVSGILCDRQRTRDRFGLGSSWLDDSMTSTKEA